MGDAAWGDAAGCESSCIDPGCQVSRSSRGVAQSGSAPGLGPGCRRFESCRPDQRAVESTSPCVSPAGSSHLRRIANSVPTDTLGCGGAMSAARSKERLRLTLDLYAFGENLLRRRLRRERPLASNREIEAEII